MSLGYSRRITAGAVAGLAAAAVTFASVPALADQVRNHEWWLQALHVPTAWQSSRGGGITVALLDTGVDPAQADLTGSVITGPDYTHSGRMPGSPEWGVHGTAMASLIAGHGHGPGNADGIMGVAPAAKVLSIRVTLEAGDPMLGDPNVAGGLPGAIAHGIRYAVRQGASVIDLPLDPVPTAGTPGSGGSPAEKAAVAYALSKGVVLVAPAGDDGAGSNPVEYPAAYPGVISVGAFDSTFTRAPFTSRQPYVTVTGPGVGVTVAGTPGGYTTISSTSAAAAVVSGIVVLVRAQFPGLTPAQITKVLEQSTVYRPAGARVPGSGYGTVDAGLALLAAARIDKAGAPSSAPASPSGPAARAPAAAVSARPAATTGTTSNLLLIAVAAAVVLILLVTAVILVMQARRRRARAARLAPIRLAAHMQPRRQALPAGEISAAAVADRIAASTSRSFAGQPASGGANPAEEPWAAASPWPPAALPGRAIESGGPAAAGNGMAAGGGPFPMTAADTGPFPAAAAGAGPFQVVAEGAGPFPAAAAGSGGGPAGDAAGGPAHAGGSRLPTRQPAGARAPKTLGAPPWAPAPKPDTELPWTATPPQRPAASVPTAAGPLPKRRPQPPEPSPWDALAAEAWPGGPGVGRPQTARHAAENADDPGAEVSQAAPGGLFGAEAGSGGSGDGGESSRADEARSRWGSFLPRRSGGAGPTGLWAGAGSSGGESETAGADTAGANGSPGIGMLSAGLPETGAQWAGSLGARPLGGGLAGSGGPGAAGAGAGLPGSEVPGAGFPAAGFPDPGQPGAGFPGAGRTPVSGPPWDPPTGDVTDSVPLRTWNPGEATESFPTLRPEEERPG